MSSPQAGPAGTTRIRVRYAETDQQGVAHHSAFVVWMEAGRTEFLRALGYPYARMEAEGLFFPVTEASCRYRAPARYDDEVEIETRVRRAQSRSVVFDYVFRVAGRSIATGSTTLVAVDAGKRPRRIPDAVLRALAGAAAGGGPAGSGRGTV
jgi:acyl-CoA thioester hydrolase